MRGEVEGESKVELRKLKTTHPHFLISSKGGIIAKCNDADVGMSLFLRGEKSPSATSFIHFNWLISVCQKPRQFQTK